MARVHGFGMLLADAAAVVGMQVDVEVNFHLY
jgi:hypothetical protein